MTLSIVGKTSKGPRAWFQSGLPWIWANAAAVGISIAAVLGLLLLIAVRGFGHFWPADVVTVEYSDSGTARKVFAQVIEEETVPLAQYRESLSREDDSPPSHDPVRYLLKTGNRRVAAPDFRWVYQHRMASMSEPADVAVVERLEWGNAIGTPVEVEFDGDAVAGERLWETMERAVARAKALRGEIERIESGRFGEINYQLERLRLARRGATRRTEPARVAEIDAEMAALREQYQVEERILRDVRHQLHRDTAVLQLADGTRVDLPISEVVRMWRPNTMSSFDKIGHFLSSVGFFVSDAPREANTEGGIYPAIFGTVLMVLLMSIVVTPFGVVAAVYLREYATQGPLVRIIRIAVNNLAGVPSIVYGVFGLGFFVYFLGGNIDRLFFTDALPAPTFGTPGLMWASLTLALLTVPVVVVSTEEGLTRIPRSIREGSLALGATKAETLFKVVLPMASPSILTGVILAVARAAGEVAPLMLVGVVKLAPSLPLDGNFPYLHLERKFMHLGFHIYDVGFQSPNVEAARPLVFATALLLVLIIIVLNLTAILLRNNLENRYRGVES